MKYMLDTNICIALIRHKPPALIRRLTSHQPDEIGISSITLAELLHGVEKSAQVEQNRSALQQFLLPLAVANFDQPAALSYGKVRAQLERKGQAIGSMDMLIAAHAISLETFLVTNNAQEFHRVRGLKLEDWISSR